MALSNTVEVQRLKERILKLPDHEQVKLFNWLEAVRDVNIEMQRRKNEPESAKPTVADKPKEDSTK